MNEIDFAPLDLATRLPFGISRWSHSEFANLVVTMTDEQGRVGFGEGAPNARYDESRDADALALEELAGALQAVEGPAAVEAFCAAQPGLPALRSALSAAAWDLAGKQAGEPVWRLLGLEQATVRTSLTIPIGDPATMLAQAHAAADFGILKVKLGFDGDLEVAALLARELPDRRFRYDANEGWDRERAARALETLARFNAELVEQPLPAADTEGQAWLLERSPVQLFGDEALLGLERLDEIVELYDGFVVKLAKAGGIAAAAALMTACRERASRVLLGCMIESSLGIAAGLQIASLADYVDLDGFLLLAADPFGGLERVGDLLMAPSAPGLGVEPSATV
ncbi:MAG TPA: enolase C-terminal domain-like protein [Thermoleophilia bacterium]|nr:enolase C-terminal domain-like protein [Thermoleophilia bacterium]